MHRARPGIVPVNGHHLRSEETGGGVLFYTMSGIFFALFAFVLWYCPRHL